MPLQSGSGPDSRYIAFESMGTLAIPGQTEEIIENAHKLPQELNKSLMRDRGNIAEHHYLCNGGYFSRAQMILVRNDL